ncbi:1,2-dihydroxy-3-keto-5-methylthiopentene dioxygenase [Varicellaria rhodocarpa]|nr:1,2-dihydroxy-3-keto-5-methylthiopentene dioxygenase [Varicellaria rhodocarpa]
MKIYQHYDQPSDAPPLYSNQKLLPSYISILGALGVLHYYLPLASPSSASALEVLSTSRRYTNRDEITLSPASLGDDYETQTKAFFEEHMHEDEEIRYILKGAGYFDVREKGDERWMRIWAEEGDLLVLPAGIYHRFSVDGSKFVKAMRLFQDAPKWASLNRSAKTEDNPIRKAYVAARHKGFCQDKLWTRRDWLGF